jgi:hypothetical protein
MDYLCFWFVATLLLTSVRSYARIFFCMAFLKGRHGAQWTRYPMAMKFWLGLLSFSSLYLVEHSIREPASSILDRFALSEVALDTVCRHSKLDGLGDPYIFLDSATSMTHDFGKYWTLPTSGDNTTAQAHLIAATNITSLPMHTVRRAQGTLARTLSESHPMLMRHDQHVAWSLTLVVRKMA